MFDVESREPDMDLHYYQTCLEAIMKSSSKAKVFCLIHKMDLIAEDQRELIFNAKASQLEKHSKPLSCSCFSTSVSEDACNLVTILRAHPLCLHLWDKWTYIGTALPHLLVIIL